MKVSRGCVARCGGSAASGTISFLAIALLTCSALMVIPCPSSVFSQDVFSFLLSVPQLWEGRGSKCPCLAFQINVVCGYEVAPAASGGCKGVLVVVWKSSCRSSSVPEVVVTTWRPPSAPQVKLESNGAAGRRKSMVPLTLPAPCASLKAGVASPKGTLQHLLPKP